MENKKEKVARQREWRKRYPNRIDSSEDGTRYNKDMATQRLILGAEKKRAEKKDPFTTHPLSFEDFDNIPDIIEEKEIK